MIVNTTFNPQLSENAGVRMELLWKNAAPKSSFEAQTLSIDLSGYSHVGILMCLMNTWSDLHLYFKNFIPVGCIGDLSGQSMGWPGSFASRVATIKTDGITFTDGYEIIYGGSSTVANTAAIPLMIYGFKGVIAT